MIRVEGLKKVYQSDNQNVLALKHIDLEIEKGEIYGIIGLSGAGKSTLIRMFNGLEKPTEGKVSIDGEDLTTLTGKALLEKRKKIGMIFQGFNLMSSRTIAQNVAYPLEIAGVPKAVIKEKVREALAWVDILEKADAYPSQLSGGQKQRVAIARALVNEPDLLLCDEATSALDPKTTQDILKLLKRINESFNLTIILITHEMSVIKSICDHVAVIDQGIIVEQGLTQVVFDSPNADITRQFIGHETSDWEASNAS